MHQPVLFLTPHTCSERTVSFCACSCPHGSDCRWGFPRPPRCHITSDRFPRVLSGSANPVAWGFMPGRSFIQPPRHQHLPHTAQSSGNTKADEGRILPEQLAGYRGDWQEIDCVASWPLGLVSTCSSLCFQTRSCAETCHPASLSFSNFTTRLHLVIEHSAA